jgi:serine/threonine protein kinase
MMDNYTEDRTGKWPIINPLTHDVLRLYERNDTGVPSRIVTKHIMDQDRAAVELRNMLILHNIPHILHLLYNEEYSDGSSIFFFRYYDTDMLDEIIRNYNDVLAGFEWYIYTRQEFMYYARCLTSAIDAIHHLHYYHGDIKLDNILVNEDDDDICLSDFGAMRKCSEPFVFMGSVAYAAPEVVTLIQDIDPKAVDIFALGTVFFAMIYGRFPHGENDINRGFLEYRAMMSMIRDNNLSGNIQLDIQQLLSKMLHKNPVERPTIHEVKNMLLAYNTSTTPTSCRRRLEFV